MNILTNYILDDQQVFMRYANDVSPNKGKDGIKLETQMILFILPPNEDNLNKVIYAYNIVNIPKKTVDLGIIFIPRETPEIIDQLVFMQLLNQIDLYSFNIDIVPTDADLYSMDLDESFREIYVENNNNSISQLANILLKFEAAFGKISK